MLSMTGYGSGSAPLGEGRVVIDVRAVNHRFLDVRVRLPHRFQEATPAVERIARERLHRGRVDVGARIEGQVLPPSQLDVERAKHAFEALRQIRDALQPDEPLPLSLLSCVPDLFISDQGPQSEALRAALAQATDEACQAVSQMRATEGDTLRAHMQRLLAEAGALLTQIEGLARAVPEAQRQRLHQRIGRLLGGTEVELEPGRLEQEVALIADRSDISEEIQRLRSHREQISGLLDEGGAAVGRRLDFLLQEMGREANTITAKSPDAELTGVAVNLKAIIEQMREQAQNIL